MSKWRIKCQLRKDCVMILTPFLFQQIRLHSVSLVCRYCSSRPQVTQYTREGRRDLHNRWSGIGGEAQWGRRYRQDTFKQITSEGNQWTRLWIISVEESQSKCYYHLFLYQQGTRRCMPPEILDQTMDFTSFQCYKWADIYSASLILYEIVSCVKFNGKQFPLLKKKLCVAMYVQA